MQERDLCKISSLFRRHQDDRHGQVRGARGRKFERRRGAGVVLADVSELHAVREHGEAGCAGFCDARRLRHVVAARAKERHAVRRVDEAAEADRGLDAQRAGVRAAERAEVTLRLFHAGERDLDVVEDAVVAVVQHGAAVRRINACAINVRLVVSEQEILDFARGGIVCRRRANRAVGVRERAAQAELVGGQDARTTYEVGGIGGRGADDDGRADGLR